MNETGVFNHGLALGRRKEFLFRTPEEARTIAQFIARVLTREKTSFDAVYFGLAELMINAVEHGNLGICREEKTRLLKAEQWQEVLHQRLKLPQNRGKFALASFEVEAQTATVTITDTGAGFAWQDYLQIQKDYLHQPNGRGIALAKSLGFGEIEFHQNGREVLCRIPAT